MKFWNDINESETIRQVNEFLTTEFEQALRLSGESRDGISSPQWSFEPSGGGYGNSQERRMERVVIAGNVVKATVETIRSCSATNSKVLIDLYLNSLSEWQVASKLGYTPEHFSRKVKPSALFEFADRYEVYSTMRNCYEDLHVYEENQDDINMVSR
ncbi:MAG: hypothetical protein MJ139_05770 [Limosilactobacillus sp.]|nr:hypothetical protein [Limosilactobacillus sp.]